MTNTFELSLEPMIFFFFFFFIFHAKINPYAKFGTFVRRVTYLVVFFAPD